VTKTWRAVPLLLSLSLAAWLPCTARADSPEAVSGNGFTFLSDATNVTHWGLGAGVGVEAKPYKKDRAEVLPLPLVYFDDKWVRLFGNSIDLKIGQLNEISVALRGQVGLFDGYKQSDAPILNGMQNRNSVTFWYGPSLAWRSAFGTLSGSYLIGGNKGQRASIEFEKTFDAGKWSFSPHVGTEWLSRKYVDYYYGVTAQEARSWRRQYSGSATEKTEVGMRLGYQLTAEQTVSLDVAVTHLGHGITDSPLVGKRFIPEARLGYMYRFK